MSTMSTDTSDDNTKLAIGELLREADPISKLVIGSYNHVSHHAVNVKSLASAKFKTEQLETCANFLGLKTRDESNQLIFTNKPTLADRIITKIESFFPSKCQDCGEGYRVKYSELQSSRVCSVSYVSSHPTTVTKWKLTSNPWKSPRLGYHLSSSAMHGYVVVVLARITPCCPIIPAKDLAVSHLTPSLPAHCLLCRELERAKVPHPISSPTRQHKTVLLHPTTPLRLSDVLLNQKNKPSVLYVNSTQTTVAPMAWMATRL